MSNKLSDFFITFISEHLTFLEERGHVREGMGRDRHLFAGKRNLKICVVRAVAETSNNKQIQSEIQQVSLL